MNPVTAFYALLKAAGNEDDYSYADASEVYRIAESFGFAQTDDFDYYLCELIKIIPNHFEQLKALITLIEYTYTHYGAFEQQSSMYAAFARALFNALPENILLVIKQILLQETEVKEEKRWYLERRLSIRGFWLYLLSQRINVSFKKIASEDAWQEDLTFEEQCESYLAWCTEGAPCLFAMDN